jgi:hypothetical protein
MQLFDLPSSLRQNSLVFVPLFEELFPFRLVLSSCSRLLLRLLQDQEREDQLEAEPPLIIFPEVGAAITKL